MDRTTMWWVRYHEDDPHQPGPYIPTKGNPTSASDIYRVEGYQKTGHEGWNSCVTDVHTCVSLAKVVEGEITSWKDIRAAEVALRLLMWHDRVDVVVPGYKLEVGGFKQYARCDSDRSKLSFELFQPLQAHDEIFAVESVKSENGVIVSSNLNDSPIVGSSIESLRGTYLEKSKLQATVMSSVALDFGVPAYFSDPLLEAGFDRAGYFFELYKAINDDWNDNDFLPPVIDSSLHLPPLLSIVLSRATSRDSIPEAIADLRQELEPSRNEILRLNSMIVGAYNQVELENETRRIKQSFEAIFAASRYEGSNVVLPLLKLYEAFHKPLDVLRTRFEPGYLSKDPRVVANRTLTGKMFQNLLVTDSMHSLISHYFTQSEIQALERDVDGT